MRLLRLRKSAVRGFWGVIPRIPTDRDFISQDPFTGSIFSLLSSPLCELVVALLPGASRQGGQRPQNFCLSEFFFLLENFRPKKILHLGKFEGKIEILSTHNVFCRKFAAVYW